MTLPPKPTGTSVWRFLLARAAEPSSWRGALLILTGVLGVAIEPALALQIVSVGVSLAGLIGVLTADRDVAASPSGERPQDRPSGTWE